MTGLNEGKNVCIAIRDTKISKENPYTTKERKKMIMKAFPEHRDRIKIIVIPDIEAICYGRGVGYDIRNIRLSDKMESVSGTKIRNGEITSDPTEELLES